MNKPTTYGFGQL